MTRESSARIRSIRWFPLLLPLSLVLVFLALGVSAAAPAPAEEGEALFREKCAACHTIGGGDRVGPDLKGVASQRDRGWLTRWLLAPDRVLAQGDPIATELLKKYNNLPMPNLGLTEAQAAALIAYMEVQAGGVPGPRPGQAVAGASAQGDPILGKDLFTGILRFQNDGPPCMACHSIAGIGALGGGALGPDLTSAYGKYRDEGITSVLASLPFPTMSPIYSKRPLTPQEQAHLRAFLQAASVAERGGEALTLLAVLAVVGAAILILAAHLLWRRRLPTLSRPLAGAGAPRIS